MSVIDQNYSIAWSTSSGSKAKLASGFSKLDAILKIVIEIYLFSEHVLKIVGPVRTVSLSGSSQDQLSIIPRMVSSPISLQSYTPIPGSVMTRMVRGNFSLFSVVTSQEPLDGAQMLTFIVHLKNGTHNATARYLSVGQVKSVDVVENYRNNLGYAVILETRPYSVSPVSMLSVAPLNGSKINFYGGTRDVTNPILAKGALDEQFLSLLVVESPNTLVIFQAPWRNLTGSWPFKQNFTISDVTSLSTISSLEGFTLIVHSNLSYTTRVYTYALATQQISAWDMSDFETSESPVKGQILQHLNCRSSSDGSIICMASVAGGFLVEFRLDPLKKMILSQYKHLKYLESHVEATDIYLDPVSDECLLLALATTSKLGIGVRQQEIQMWKCGVPGFKLLASYPVSEIDQADPTQTHLYPFAAFQGSVFVGSLNSSAPIRNYKVGGLMLEVKDVSKIELSKVELVFTGNQITRIALDSLFDQPPQPEKKKYNIWIAVLAVVLVAGSLGLFFLLGKFTYKQDEQKGETGSYAAAKDILDDPTASIKISFKEEVSHTQL